MGKLASPIPWQGTLGSLRLQMSLAVSRFDGKRLRFAGMPGGLKVHLHRELPEDADVRSCVFRQDGSGWFVCLQIAVPLPRSAPCDCDRRGPGLTVFAYLQ